MDGQLDLSTQKTLKNIVLYFLLFLAGDFINSLVFDLFFSAVELPYRELYSILRMSGQLFFTCLFFWIYTVKVLHLKMRSFGISFDIKPWGVLFSVFLPAFAVSAFLLLGKGDTNSFEVSKADFFNTYCSESRNHRRNAIQRLYYEAAGKLLEHICCYFGSVIYIWPISYSFDGNFFDWGSYAFNCKRNTCWYHVFARCLQRKFHRK